MIAENAETRLYGVVAEFKDPEALIEASKRVRDAGYKWFEAYSPFPVHGLAAAVGFRHSKVPMLVLLGGIIGCVGGFGFQYWVSVIAYPMNIGGRPLNSWPAFVPITFETTVLCATLFAVLGMLALNGLPRPHHPLFAVKSFTRATRDGFFLCVQTRDKMFDADKVRRFLQTLEPIEIQDVPQ